MLIIDVIDNIVWKTKLYFYFNMKFILYQNYNNIINMEQENKAIKWDIQNEDVEIRDFLMIPNF